MRKSKAIKILQRQKQAFIDKSYVSLSVWLKKTGSYIGEFLGHNSIEYSSFSKFEFTERFMNMPDEFIKLTKNREIIEILGLLQNSIDKLKTGKLFKPKKKNVLSNKSNWKLITIAVAIFLAGLYAGIWLKNNTSFSFFSTIDKSSNNHSNSETPK